MNCLATMMRSCVAEEDGVTAIEYGLIGALIAVVIIGAVALLGGEVSSMYDYIANEVVNAIATP
ncbi:MAG: Flp family type IVb pilin [Candidatus Electrothrix sp. ATG2]|nr:Flp family type IVb pilin [Candidatus Electrothrix sp. ATG2]